MFGDKIFFSDLLKTSTSKDLVMTRNFPAKTEVKNISQNSRQDNLISEKISSESKPHPSGFGGLGVSALAFGTQVRRFKPGRNCRIFQGKKSSARLPSEGK
jgi:hypothetical protein